MLWAMAKLRCVRAGAGKGVRVRVCRWDAGVQVGCGCGCMCMCAHVSYHAFASMCAYACVRMRMRAYVVL